MKRIGLTGGIGSGKTTIALIFKKLGFHIYIADREATLLINTHADIRREMTQRFGENIYEHNGKLNKSRLADMIFSDSTTLAEVNRIVHPRVVENFSQWCTKQSGTFVIFESAILFEAGLNHFFDAIICVTAPESIRLERVLQRDNTTTGKVRERIASQQNDDLKCKQSDFIIYNDNEHMVIKQVLSIADKLTD